MTTIDMPKKRILCADGFSMSVQASDFHYCHPRVSGLGFYSEYEVGFPSAEEPLLTPYAEEPSALTATVYSYVPVRVIVDVIAKHGGVVGTTSDEED